MRIDVAMCGPPVTATAFDGHLVETFTPAFRKFPVQFDRTQPYRRRARILGDLPVIGHDSASGQRGEERLCIVGDDGQSCGDIRLKAMAHEGFDGLVFQ